MFNNNSQSPERSPDVNAIKAELVNTCNTGLRILHDELSLAGTWSSTGESNQEVIHSPVSQEFLSQQGKALVSKTIDQTPNSNPTAELQPGIEDVARNHTLAEDARAKLRVEWNSNDD